MQLVLPTMLTTAVTNDADAVGTTMIMMAVQLTMMLLMLVILMLALWSCLRYFRLHFVNSPTSHQFSNSAAYSTDAP